MAHTILQTLARSAFIGFAASVISDTVSNSLRVVKTYRQVNETRISYIEAARAVIAVDGWRGLFGRGLKTRILANGLQGLMFTVLWKLFLDLCVVRLFFHFIRSHIYITGGTNIQSKAMRESYIHIAMSRRIARLNIYGWTIA